MTDFAAIMNEAMTAANEAGKQWLADAEAKGPQFYVGNEGLLDLCGNAYITITDKRTKFAQWLKKNDKHAYDFGPLPDHDYKRRQEYNLHRTIVRAVLKVYTKHGITGLAMRAYID